MQLALLWQDEKGTALQTLVARAALRFREKYTAGWPDTAMVHPALLASMGHADGAMVNVGVPGVNGNEAGGCVIRVLPGRYTQPNQVLIGLEEEPLRDHEHTDRRRNEVSDD